MNLDAGRLAGKDPFYTPRMQVVFERDDSDCSRHLLHTSVGVAHAALVTAAAAASVNHRLGGYRSTKNPLNAAFPFSKLFRRHEYLDLVGPRSE